MSGESCLLAGILQDQPACYDYPMMWWRMTTPCGSSPPNGLVMSSALRAALALTGLTALVAFGAGGCPSRGERARREGSGSTGPQVESEPGPLHRCAGQPMPRVEVRAAPRAPVRLERVRAYATCLGEYVTLLRLTGRAGSRGCVAVSLERTWLDVRGRRAPRRDVQGVARPFGPGTVRYVRVRWREGRDNPGERWLRIRLLRVDSATGSLWRAPPARRVAWPPAPGRSGSRRPPARSLIEEVGHLRSLVRSAGKSVQRVEAQISASSVVRSGAAAHRPGPERREGARATRTP